jgi:EAL domain-containing protein (putative c-di-GMP-specific phosphodiesterase class I)
VSAVVDLAHIMGMTVVAVGIETAEQQRHLAALDCDFCQGFYFAPPMSAYDLDTIMEHRVAGQDLHLPELATAPGA